MLGDARVSLASHGSPRSLMPLQNSKKKENLAKLQTNGAFCSSVFPEIFLLCHTTPTPHPSSPIWPFHSKCYSYREHHGGPAEKQFPHEISGLAFENPLHFLETAGCGQDTFIMARSPHQSVTITAHKPPQLPL